MTYTEFIKGLQKELNENGVRITQDKLKTIFEVMGQFIIDNIGYEEQIIVREFLLFDLIQIPPMKLPNGEMSKKQYSMKVRMSDKYKKRLKDALNK